MPALPGEERRACKPLCDGVRRYDPALAVVLDPELDGFPPEALLELDFFLFLMRRQREQAGGNGGGNS